MTEIKQELPNPSQDEAAKSAIIASGNYWLTAIYQKKMNETHAKVANLVAQVMSLTDKTTNWTQEEITAIWGDVETGLLSQEENNA